ENTGVVYNGTTTGAGTYSFPSLIPGPYSITVTQPGFQTFTSVHNILTVGAPLVVDVTLKVGGVTETVQVESSYARLETSNAASERYPLSQFVCHPTSPFRDTATGGCSNFEGPFVHTKSKNRQVELEFTSYSFFLLRPLSIRKICDGLDGFRTRCYGRDHDYRSPCGRSCPTPSLPTRQFAETQIRRVLALDRLLVGRPPSPRSPSGPLFGNEP